MHIDDLIKKVEQWKMPDRRIIMPQSAWHNILHRIRSKPDSAVVTRFEVIDHTKSAVDGGGRTFVYWGDKIKVEWSFQDMDRTLKIFLTKK